MEFFSEIDKRACPFIREVRVSSEEHMELHKTKFPFTWSCCRRGSIPFLHKRTPWAPSIKGAIPNFCPGKDRRMDGKKTPCSFQISLEGLNTSLMHGSIECKLCTSFHRDFYFIQKLMKASLLFSAFNVIKIQKGFIEVRYWSPN